MMGAHHIAADRASDGSASAGAPNRSGGSTMSDSDNENARAMDAYARAEEAAAMGPAGAEAAADAEREALRETEIGVMPEVPQDAVPDPSDGSS